MKKRFIFGALMMLCVIGFAQTIDNAFFDKVDYRGAFGTTDWTTGWSNFNPQTAVYPATETTLTGNISSKMTLGSPLYAASSFTATPLTNSFFDQVDYVGAFGKTNWTEGWANFNPQSATYPAATTTVSGNITTNTTWTSSQVYLLNGFVRVQNGVVLTIEPGTVIRGDKASTGSLIIEPGAQLIANGTASNPIVFTSNQDAGVRNYGDWGGVVLVGNAPTNKVNPVVEGGIGNIYGGTVPTDNSGSLKYVRIEFPGVALTTTSNSEINGLTMCGVGSGTTIDYVQVSYSGDDSFEWFGGTVNCKHLIAFRGWDDDFDTDFGYVGNVQFGVSLRDPAAADQSSSNSFESDNDGTGTAATPLTAPVFSNISSFGPLATPTTTIHSRYASAMHLRRNTSIKIFNSVFAGWPKGLLIDGAAAQTNADAENLLLKNVVMSACTSNFVPTTPWTSTDEENWFNRTGYNNSIIADNSSLALVDPFNLTTPGFTTKVKSYLLNGFVRVQNGVVLTIEPGTVIRGDKASTGSLIIEPGAQLIANGTVSNPIVFTSNQDAGVRNYGDWGGVVLVGNAPTNKVNPVVEGGIGNIYGGTVSNDNSGSLKYVRIEFPGVALTTTSNSEINGLTMCGVGSGTTIDYVQVSYSGDDSFEWFGGTVNCKHLIAFRGWDDDFDTDFGYVGNVQFGVSLRDPAAADQSSSNSFESDNDGTGTAATPLTAPVFSNISSFGPLATPTTTIHSRYASAMHLRRNTSIKIYNSIFAGWPKGLLIDGAGAQTNANAENLLLRNVVMSACTSNFVPTTPWTSTDEQNWYNTAAYKNITLTDNANLKITDPFSLTAPNFMPTATSKMKELSYWQFIPTEGLQYSVPMVFTAYANGSQITTPGSMLMIYKNNECLGSQEISTSSNTFRISVGSNESTNAGMDIKLYDASSRMLYNLPTVVDFDSEGTVGTPSSPVRLDATGSLTIPLYTGGAKYNWISFNVLPENNSVGNVLNYTASNNDYISDGNESSFYFDGVWYGMESTGLVKNKMYVLYTVASAPGSISITNQPLVKNEPVTFNAGYNWFGYPLLNAYDINVALNGLTASVDDNVITQGKNSWYSTGGWDAMSMTPGKGYIFKATSGSTFTFPANNASTSVKVKSFNTDNAVATVWAPEVGQRYAMPVLAQVYRNGNLFQTEGMQMGIFKDGQCLGAATLKNNVFNVTVGANFETLSGLNCKVYDPKTSITYDVEEAVDFESLVSVGKISTPAAFRVKATSTQDEIVQKNFNVYPSQIESKIEFTLSSPVSAQATVAMYNLQGKFVKSLYNGSIENAKTVSIERENLNGGLYLIKASIGENQYIQKVVLK